MAAFLERDLRVSWAIWAQVTDGSCEEIVHLRLTQRQVVVWEATPGRAPWQSCATKLLVQLPFLILSKPLHSVPPFNKHLEIHMLGFKERKNLL